MSALRSSSTVNYGPYGHNFDLFAKIKFESKADSFLRRSQLFEVAERQKVYDIWKLSPPDFNPQAFEPVPVERNSRDAVKPWLYDKYTSFKPESAPTAKDRRRNDKRKNDFFRELEMKAALKISRAQTCGGSLRQNNEDFRLRFKILDPHQAKKEFVKKGMYKPGSYEMPQPHDYRQYPRIKSLGLPDFATNYDRDCFGLNCRARGISTLNGPSVDVLRDVGLRKKSEYEMPRPLKWDDQLILPKLPFPNKIAAYTRHRRKDRSARSAFLERAEVMMEKRKREVEEFKARLSNNQES